MVIRLKEHDAQAQLPQLLNKVHQGDQVVVVEASGKPLAALIPAALYDQLIAERDTRFQVLDRIRQRLPGVPASEVERDLAEIRQQSAERLARELAESPNSPLGGRS